jgi:hypothetical protein
MSSSVLEMNIIKAQVRTLVKAEPDTAPPAAVAAGGIDLSNGISMQLAGDRTQDIR